jgi:toxin secretion/phage lysis holin
MNYSAIYKFIAAALGAATGYLFGGWTMLLGVLLTFVIIDYITGVLASAINHRLSSKVGYKGIAKKVMMFAIIAVGHLIDVAFGGSASVFRDAAIYFYLANELLSIIENAGVAGLPVPQQIENAVEILKGKNNKE